MKIHSLLSRYLSRSFLLSFLVMLTCLFIIIILFDFAELQRRIGAKEVSFLMKSKMVILRAPHFLEHVLPFVVFVSGLFTFWRMNRTNELLICRSSGISLWRIIMPISLAALFIGLIDLTAFNPLSSAMEVRFEELEKRYLSKSKEDIKVASTGLWLSEQVGSKHIIYRASAINLEKLEFQNLNIIVFSWKNGFLERIDAKVASIDGDRLDLKDGWVTRVGETAAPFATKSIETSLNKKKIEDLKVNRGMFSFWKLPSYIDLLDASGLQSLKYQMYWNSMLASAFWVAAMIVLAAAFSCRPLRQGKTAIMILLGLLVGFFLYFFKDMTFALGVSGALPHLIASWLPPLVTLMIGSVLVFYQEDG